MLRLSLLPLTNFCTFEEALGPVLLPTYRDTPVREPPL